MAGREGKDSREEGLALLITYFFFLFSIFKDMRKICPDISKYVSGCLLWCSIFFIQFKYSRIEIFVYIYILE